MVERINLDDLGAGRRARGTPRPHQARDCPAGVAEGLRCHVADPAAGTEHQDA
jgi:hypothetical protein